MENAYQLTIQLSQEETDALASLAKDQRRSPGDQAAHLIREALMEYGLITWKPHVWETVDESLLSHDEA